jgi:hypothetical protein
LDPIFRHFAIGDVAKVPDSTAVLFVAIDEGGRVSIEYLSILEPELIPAFLLPVAIEILDSLDK